MTVAIYFGFVSGLMVLGRWLESIGGKDGFWDEFFSPLPMGLSGLILIAAERIT